MRFNSSTARAPIHVAIAIAAIVSCAHATILRAQPPALDPAVRTVADSFVAWSRTPGASGIWPDYTDASSTESARRLDGIANQLRAIDQSAPRTLVRPRGEKLVLDNLRESVESQIGIRTCRLDLWSTVSQLGGWHVRAINWTRSVANAGTKSEQALGSLRTLPTVVQAHQRLLQRGLDSGFVAPRPVVSAVVAQIDALISTGGDSPLMAPAQGDTLSEFARNWRTLVKDSLLPTIRTYREFLAGPYLAGARASGSLATMRDGSTCYRAWLQQQTSVAGDPESMMREAREKYDVAIREIAPLVKRLTGKSDVVEGIRQLRSGRDFAFTSRDSILPAYRALAKVAESRMNKVVTGFMAESLAVMPYSSMEEQADPPPRYNQSRGDNAAQFMVNLGRTERMSAADAVAHEAYPGHHLQRITSRRATPAHPVMQQMFFGSFVEGWGIYSEQLGDEIGLYADDLSRAGYLIHLTDVFMGFYLDVGFHVRGWSRDMLVDTMMTVAGRARSNAEAYADRHAGTPGQLATYFVGWRTFVDGRARAAAALGSRFDSRLFHDETLRDGSVSLASLSEKITTWIAEQKKAGAAP